jgi:hypothetical protein
VGGMLALHGLPTDQQKLGATPKMAATWPEL